MIHALILTVALSNPPTAADASVYVAYVDRVIDGDTIVADISLGWDLWLLDQPIRLKSCYAPELSTAKGPESKKALESLLDFDRSTPAFEKGASVLLRSGTAKAVGEREKYGRVLGDVFVDGVSVGAQQVRTGHARATP